MSFLLFLMALVRPAQAVLVDFNAFCRDVSIKNENNKKEKEKPDARFLPEAQHRDITYDVGGGDEVFLGYYSRIPKEAGDPHAVAETVREALSRYGVPRQDVYVNKVGENEYELAVGLGGIPDVRTRRHVAHHARQFTLRDFFSKLELMGKRASDVLLNMEPAQADRLVRELSFEDTAVIAQWTRRMSDHQIPTLRKLAGCE